MEGLHGIVLAAGEGERLGGIYPKPFTPVNGVPVAARLLKSLREVGCENLTLVVRAQDEELGRAVVSIAGLDEVGAVVCPQSSMDPDDRIAGVIGDKRTAMMRTIVALGDNIYLPHLAPFVALRDAPQDTMQVVVRSTYNVHGLSHDDERIHDRRIRSPLHDIGVYMIPEGGMLGMGTLRDRSLLAAMLKSGEVGFVKLHKDVAWVDIGTPADLARADLLLRAAEGPCVS